MFSHFFIDRPIFATVLSIVIVIVGVVALTQLPIAQYPEVAPPTVSVTATYPGAEAKLPEEVKRQGVTTKKKSPSILLCVNLISDKETDPQTGKAAFKYDQLYLSNYATIYVKDELARVKGVGDVTFLGPRDYSM